jgi:hypothetical protein
MEQKGNVQANWKWELAFNIMLNAATSWPQCLKLANEHEPFFCLTSRFSDFAIDARKVIEMDSLPK